MDYKILSPITQEENICDTTDQNFLPFDDGESNDDSILYIKFEELVSEIKNLDKCVSINEKNSILKINDFYDKIVDFYKKPKDNLDINKIIKYIQKYDTINYLIKYSYPGNKIELSRISLLSISSFLVFYPDISILIIPQFGSILNSIFEKSLVKENQILLPPAYKGFGNMIFALPKNSISLFLKSINFGFFINSLHYLESYKIKSYYLYANFSIYRYFSQNSYVLNVDVIKEFLIFLNSTICSEISIEICEESEVHSYALNSIYLFLKSEYYSIELKKNAIVESEISKTIDRYFKIPNLIREQLIALNIICIFYSLDIEDYYNCISNTIPIFSIITNNPNHNFDDFKNICLTIAEVLQTKACVNFLVYLYSNNFLNILYNFIKHSPNYKEKSISTGLLSIIADFNANVVEFVPMNEFFFSDMCIELFMSLLDNENNYYCIQILKVLNRLIDFKELEFKEDEFFQLIFDNDGISTIDNLMNSKNRELVGYATIIIGKIDKFLKKIKDNS